MAVDFAAISAHFPHSSDVTEQPHPTFDSVYKQHFTYLTKVVASHGVPESDADDVVQEVLIEVHRSLHTYDPARGAKLTTWLYTVTRRTVLRYRRRHSPDGEVTFEALGAALSLPAPGAACEAQLIEAEERAFFYATLERLPAARRIAFEHCELMGMKVSAAAALLGLRESTVRRRIKLAHHDVSEAFKRRRAAERRRLGARVVPLGVLGLVARERARIASSSEGEVQARAAGREPGTPEPGSRAWASNHARGRQRAAAGSSLWRRAGWLAASHAACVVGGAALALGVAFVDTRPPIARARLPSSIARIPASFLIPGARSIVDGAEGSARAPMVPSALVRARRAPGARESGEKVLEPRPSGDGAPEEQARFEREAAYASRGALAEVAEIDEASLLVQAQAALDRGDCSAMRGLVDRHERAYPNGALAWNREALKARACIPQPVRPMRR